MKTKTTLLHFNISIYLKATVERLFQDKTQKELNKIYFLIHQINKGGQIEINNRTYAEGLSMRTGELSQILSLLKDEQIIKTVNRYNPGTNSFKYKMVNGYNINSSMCDKVSFDAQHTTCPKWIKQYIANGGEFRLNKNNTDLSVLSSIGTDNQYSDLNELKESLEVKDLHILALETKHIKYVSKAESTIQKLEDEIKLLRVQLAGNIPAEKKANSTALQAARPAEKEKQVDYLDVNIDEATELITVKEFDNDGNQVIIQNYHLISHYPGIEYLLYDIEMGAKGLNYFNDKAYSFQYEKAVRSTFNGDIITATIIN